MHREGDSPKVSGSGYPYLLDELLSFAGGGL
jgi:hypothetical protein